MTLGLCSPKLAEAGFRHAFFMRQGGVSPEPWHSLNFSTASGDAPEAVNTNLRRASAELGVKPEQIYYLSQVHGCTARLLSGQENREEILYCEGDITLSQSSDVACGIRTADCLPLLLADTSTGAVAAIHCGWRGTVAGVVTAGLAALQKLAGSPGSIMAAIGPHIQACCFEIGDEVADQLVAASSAGNAAIDRSHRKPHGNLSAVVSAQLTSLGVEDIELVDGCTVCSPERFHSYRRDGPRSGRMLAAIVPKASV